MYTKNNLIIFLAIILAIFLTGCGTFEIGIESNTLLEPTIQTVEVPLEPTSIPPAEEPTAQPDLSDEARIGAALAERLGFAIGEVLFTISQLTEEHASGNISNGYFLAVKLDGQWVAVYDGQANPYCREVDLYAFPSGMVPECLSDSNQLIVRSGSVNPPTSSLQSLDCGVGSQGANIGTVEFVACNVQDGLRSRNTSALLGYMVDPFTIGYWQSEGVMAPPEEMLVQIQNLYNFNDPDYIPPLDLHHRSQSIPGSGRIESGGYVWTRCECRPGCLQPGLGDGWRGRRLVILYPGSGWNIQMARTGSG